jgi:ligand-binding sensor domain-containing protein
VCLAIGWAGVPALASGSDRSIQQFVHRDWTSKDRAPRGILVLAQTRDGYLWLGTVKGLYRFDGISFDRYGPQYCSHLLWFGDRRLRQTSAQTLASGSGRVTLEADREGGAKDDRLTLCARCEAKD